MLVPELTSREPESWAHVSLSWRKETAQCNHRMIRAHDVRPSNRRTPGRRRRAKRTFGFCWRQWRLRWRSVSSWLRASGKRPQRAWTTPRVVSSASRARPRKVRQRPRQRRHLAQLILGANRLLPLPKFIKKYLLITGPSRFRGGFFILRRKRKKGATIPARFSRTLGMEMIMPNSLTPPDPKSMVRAVDLPERPVFLVFWMD